MLLWFHEEEGRTSLRHPGPFAPEDRLVEVDVAEGDSADDILRKAVAAHDAAGVAVPDHIREYLTLKEENPMSIDADEKVLCVPTDAIRQLGYFQGVNADWEKYLHNLLGSTLPKFLPRHEVENDPNWKQLIPYLVIRYRTRRGNDVEDFLLQYHRTKVSGEARLRGKATIGIGGHINPIDDSQDATLAFQKGWRRELKEEVRMDTRFEVDHLAVLNDDSDMVGKVHFGIVLLINVGIPCVYPNNHEAIEMRFVNVRDFPYPATDQYEGWTRLLLDSDLLIKR